MRDTGSQDYRYNSKLSTTMLQAVAGMFLCVLFCDVETQGALGSMGKRGRKRTRLVLAHARSRRRKHSHPGRKTCKKACKKASGAAAARERWRAPSPRRGAIIDLASAASNPKCSRQHARDAMHYRLSTIDTRGPASCPAGPLEG